MPIVGDHPEAGLRIDVERPARGGPPWSYRGEATTPRDRFSIGATVSANGDVSVETPADAPEGLADKVRRLLRAAWKHARQDGVAPARRIQRWRADR